MGDGLLYQRKTTPNAELRRELRGGHGVGSGDQVGTVGDGKARAISPGLGRGRRLLVVKRRQGSAVAC